MGGFLKSLIQMEGFMEVNIPTALMERLMEQHPPCPSLTVWGVGNAIILEQVVREGLSEEGTAEQSK